MKRFLLLMLLAGFGYIAPGFSQSLDYSFVVVGCNRVDYLDTAATTGKANSTGASTANVYQLKRLFTEVAALKPQPKYLFLAGDIVMGYTNDTVSLAKQLTNWIAIYQNHPISKTGIKLVTIPGNHETQDKAAGKKSYAAAERTWLRIMAPYIIGSNGPGKGGLDNLTTDQSKMTYSFNYGCDHFVLCNTDPVGADATVPYKWIANDLKAARAANARHIFAIGHKPAYATPFKPLDGLEANLAARDSFWKYLEKYQAEAMFCAHNHVWDTVHPNAGKTWQVIAGNGGSLFETTWQGKNQAYFGWTLVSVMTNGKVNVDGYGRDVDVANYTLDGDTYPTTLRASVNITLSPVIDHTPLSNNSGMGPFTITATITDDIAVKGAQLNYWVNGSLRSAIAASVSGSTYTFKIPAQTIPGVIQYNIQATDASGILVYSGGCSSSLHRFNFGMKNGPSSTQTAYVVPTQTGVTFTPIMTTGDSVGTYKMCGIPDGLGAFDNNDGTFTLLMNHELTSPVGVPRAHGSKGAFVSKWIIKKSDYSVQSGSDLMKTLMLWDTATSSYKTYNSSNPSALTALSRFCSADLPPVAAFYNSATGLGTKERIFMNGEENNDESRAFAHIVTGANGGTSYELPALGKGAWENAVASPSTGDKTVVGLTNDGTDGQVYFYIGTKTSTGTEVDMAGLTNGKPYGVKVSGFSKERSNATTLNPLPQTGARFSMVDMGNVKNITGVKFNANSNTLGVTSFSRPEDGAWDPSNPNDFYFNTTDQIDQLNDGVGTQIGRTRVWRLRFDDVTKPENGGTIEAVLDGTEGPNMLDNMAIDNYGHIILLEDVGGSAHNGKVWQYTIATDELKMIAKHDPSRFGDVNMAPTAPFNNDEETSGIIDVSNILGAGMFLLVDQAHYALPGQLVEGGQLMALYNPDTYNSTYEVNLKGNKVNITKGDTSPSVLDNTDFGTVYMNSSVTKTFYLQNTGAGDLTVTGISTKGPNSSDFRLIGLPATPFKLKGGDSLLLTCRLTPAGVDVRRAILVITSNDLDESTYDVALKGFSIDNSGIDPQNNTKINTSLFPNPAGNTATLSMTLANSEHLKVSVLDISGKIVGQSIENNYSAGEQKIELNTATLTNGVYFIMISSSTETKRMKMVVTH